MGMVTTKRAVSTKRQFKAIKMLTLLAVMCGFSMNDMIAWAPISSAQAETSPATWVADVPIMPLLDIEKGLGFAFDNPEGRVVTIYLSGKAERNRVMAYYDQALAPLGWTKQSNNLWHRRNESLTINKTPSATLDLWKIMVRPK